MSTPETTEAPAPIPVVLVGAPGHCAALEGALHAIGVPIRVVPPDGGHPPDARIIAIMAYEDDAPRPPLLPHHVIRLDGVGEALTTEAWAARAGYLDATLLRPNAGLRIHATEVVIHGEKDNRNFAIRGRNDAETLALAHDYRKRNPGVLLSLRRGPTTVMPPQEFASFLETDNRATSWRPLVLRRDGAFAAIFRALYGLDPARCEFRIQEGDPRDEGGWMPVSLVGVMVSRTDGVTLEFVAEDGDLITHYFRASDCVRVRVRP